MKQRVGFGAEVSAVKKLPYIPSQRATDKMTEDQKRGVQMWNMMRQALIDNGLMESK